MLSNLETSKEKILQIVLSGQPGVLPTHCQVVIQPNGQVKADTVGPAVPGVQAIGHAVRISVCGETRRTLHFEDDHPRPNSNGSRRR
mgnify:CR=1 FL=1